MVEQQNCMSLPPYPLDHLAPSAAAKRARTLPEAAPGDIAAAPTSPLGLDPHGHAGMALPPALTFWELLLRPMGQPSAGLSATPLFKVLVAITERIALTKQDKNAASWDALLDVLSHCEGPLCAASMLACDLQLGVMMHAPAGVPAAQAAAQVAAGMALRERCSVLLMHPQLPQLLEQYTEFTRVGAQGVMYRMSTCSACTAA